MPPQGHRTAEPSPAPRLPRHLGKGPGFRDGFELRACGFLEQSASVSGEFPRAGAVGEQRSRQVPALSPRAVAGEGRRRGQSPSIDNPVPGPLLQPGSAEPPRSAQRTVSASGQGGKRRGERGKPGAGKRTGFTPGSRV